MDKSIPYSPSRLDSTLFFKNSLPKYLDKANNVADIGCGRLFFLNFLKSTKFRGKYFGIDIKTTPVLSRTKFKATTVNADFLKYPLRRKFDIAACLWVLEHIKKDDEAIHKISQILKPDGVLILAVPSIWSWPFEFGRHGYHYYSLNNLKRLISQNGLMILESHSCAGSTGFIFMIIYNWLRYFLLVPALIIYRIAKVFHMTNISWQDFSVKLISSTLYYYHRSKTGVLIHNKIIESILKLDAKIKLFPASYILIVQKK